MIRALRTQDQLDYWKQRFESAGEGERVYMLGNLVHSFPEKGARVTESDKFGFLAYEYAMKFRCGWNTDLKKRHRAAVIEAVTHPSAMLGDVLTLEEAEQFLLCNTQILCDTQGVDLDSIEFCPAKDFPEKDIQESPNAQCQISVCNGKVEAKVLYNQDRISKCLGHRGCSELLWLLASHEVAHGVQSKVVCQEGGSREKVWLYAEYLASNSAFDDSGSHYSYDLSLAEEDSGFAGEEALKAVLKVKNGIDLSTSMPREFWGIFTEMEGVLFDLKKLLSEPIEETTLN